MLWKFLSQMRQTGLHGMIRAGVLVLAAGGFASAGQAQQDPLAASCGYQVTSGTYSTWPGGYQAWVDVSNVSGQTATDFEVLIDIGNTTITGGHLADYQQVENGYSVTAPSWLQWQQIPPGGKYRFQFNGAPNYEGVAPYVISINGVVCDTAAPSVSLSANSGFFNADGTLTLTAEATDNVAVRKVVFEQGGEVIGEDWDAPFELDVNVDEDLNGFRLYTATAYDPTGNQAASESARVTVAIGNKFFGTAPSGPEDYEHLLVYFNQLTPENAGKWGSVEGTRDTMNWTDLDIAYNFARDNGIPFKLHTLVWGQQQPAWIDDLPPEEQLAEIEEWFGEVAARYTDLEMIEVVNEPLHAPPSYAEALGGAGETGWDWVIKAFEMARAHFPNTQLILNDYQILHLPEFTADYLEVIAVLQERGLIDAIGVQAHFLERTQGSMVQINLDTLAATGLPIYATEFDLNLANDAQQANQMRELFTVLWEHASVIGVTHWGHMQGSVWRPNAYLLRTDGSERPAMQWLVCYLAGGGDICTVPEYIPMGWQGGEFGVTLEAELYDDGEGLVALGGVVAFTNPGDWISFAGVEFRNDWDKLWVNYTKGNDPDGLANANITIHFGSLENAPVMTVPLPYTGGWNNFQTIELDWSAIGTTEDVYISFNDDAEAVANLDSIRFGKEQVLDDGELVVDGGFEDAVLADGWGVWFAGGTELSLSTAKAFAGSKSLLAGNRVANSHPTYVLTGLVEPGVTYSVSAQALHMGTANDTIIMTAKLACAGQSDAFTQLANVTGIAPDTWTGLSGDWTIPEGCDVTEARIYFEGTTVGVDLYLDEVSVAEPPATENLMSNGGFETGTTGWSSWNGSTLSASTAQAHEGSQSLLATARPNTNQFAVSPNIGAALTPDTTYPVSAWVYQTGAGADTVRLAAKILCESGETYPWIHNHTSVPANTWTQLSGPLAIPADCGVITEVLIFFEGTTAGVDVYIDEIEVVGESTGAANLLANGGFETGITGWQSWNGSTLSATTTQVYAGSQSLLATDRPDTNQFAVYNLTSVVSPGATYAVSAQVLQAGAATDTVRMAAKVECTAETAPEGHNSFPWLHNNTGVNPGEWTGLSANLVIPDCDIVDVAIFFEGTTAGVDVYLDEVSVVGF